MHGSLFSRRGLAIVAVSVVSLIGCCLLAWWQWTRYQSPGGTLQNFGYVLQWPLFGMFPAFMFYRIHQADKQRQAELDAEQAEGAGVPEPRAAEAEPAAEGSATAMPEWNAQRAYVQNTTVTYQDDGEDGQDGVLLAYNQYLGQLAAQEERHAG